MAVNQWLNQAANISINYVGSTAYIHVPTNGSYNIYLNPNQQLLKNPNLRFNIDEWPLKFNKVKYWGFYGYYYYTNYYKNNKYPFFGFVGSNRNHITSIGNGIILSQNQLCGLMALHSAPYAYGDIYFNVDFPSQFEAAGTSILGRQEEVRSNSPYAPALLTGLFYNQYAPTHNMQMMPRSSWVNFHVHAGSLVNDYIYNYMVANYVENDSTSSPNVRYNKITWTTMENGYYNSTYKIRVYYNNPHYEDFNNLKDISFAFFSGSSYWSSTPRHPNTANLQPICSDNVIDMSQAYAGWDMCTGHPVCGNNVTDMSYAYAGCRNLTGSPVVGNNVKYMVGAYVWCNNLTGSPVRRDNVIDMSYAYSGCTKLTGHPMVGSNVINMRFAYSNCYNLNGVAACGPNVRDMGYAYYNCTNLSGSPLHSSAVTDMDSTYYNCGNITGGVTDDFYGVKLLNYTFYNCNNLTGYAGPTVFNQVWKSCYTFYNCRKLNTLTSIYYNIRNIEAAYGNCTGLQSAGSLLGLMYYDRYFVSSNIRWNKNGGWREANDIVRAYNIFGGVNNRMNVMVVKGREWDQYLHNYPNFYQFKGMSIVWTDMENGYYNTAANIYVYNNHNPQTDSSSPYYGYNVMNEVNASNIYQNRGDLIGTPVCGDIIQNLAYTYYYCNNLTGAPACGNNVYNMSNSYYGCSNLNGSPVIGPNVKFASSAYAGCYNLTGSPVCPDKVINAYNTYYHCNGLTGSPVVGNNVVTMSHMYEYCSGLTGSPVFGPNVQEVIGAYRYCNNLTGTFVIPNNMGNLQFLYDGCGGLMGSLNSLLNDGNHNYIFDLGSTFSNCKGLTGSPWCGPAVENFASTYSNCQNLTGSPVCGSNVINMGYAYSNCQNLTGSPVCGSNVNNMVGTYTNCYNLTGSPVCGGSVTSMYATYQNCINLTGQPIFGPLVNYIANAYYGCTKLTGTVYWNYSGTNLNTIDRVAGNTHHVFGGRNNTGSRINLYVANRYVFNNLRNITNSQSLVGTVTWNNYGTNFFFNTTHNLYVYTGASYPTNTYTTKIVGTGTNCLLNGLASYSATSSTTTSRYNVSLTADGVDWQVPSITDLNTWIKVLGAEYEYIMTNNIAATISLKNMAPDVQITAHGAIKNYYVTITGNNLLLNGAGTYSGTIETGTSVTITLAASGDYKLPQTISFNSLNVIAYDRTSDTAGTVTISPIGTSATISENLVAEIKRADLTYTTTNCTSASTNPTQCTDTNYASLQLTFTFDGTTYTCPSADMAAAFITVSGAEFTWTKQSNTSGYISLTKLTANNISISVAGVMTSPRTVTINATYEGGPYPELNVYSSYNGIDSSTYLGYISDSDTGTFTIDTPFIVLSTISGTVTCTGTSGGVSEYSEGYSFVVTADGTLDVTYSSSWDDWGGGGN